MTFEEQYDFVCSLIHEGYEKVGWHEEIRPMILTFKGNRENIDVYILAGGADSPGAFQDYVNGVHKDLSKRPDVSSAILIIEAWTKAIDAEELGLVKDGLRIENDPAREEVVMVNIRSKLGQRVGMVKLSRANKRTTPTPLIDPYGKGPMQYRGRYIDKEH